MTIRQAVEIPVHPWYHDHFFNNATILPAVEAMLFLAGIARDIRPDIRINSIVNARFMKILAIPLGAEKLSAFVEYEEKAADSADDFQIRLLSRIQFKKIRRIKEHVELSFCMGSTEAPDPPELPAKEIITIEAERIYRELVPFGPAYRSLQGSLQLSGPIATGRLEAPSPGPSHPLEKELGSPFPLDGAMHAASVLGQCITDFVPFPVGFEKRLIHRPTRPGTEYRVTVHSTARTTDELLFDLWIFDCRGNCCETVTGLKMRDVSRGAVRPPADLPSVTFSPQ